MSAVSVEGDVLQHTAAEWDGARVGARYPQHAWLLDEGLHAHGHEGEALVGPDKGRVVVGGGGVLQGCGGWQRSTSRLVGACRFPFADVNLPQWCEGSELSFPKIQDHKFL